MATFFPKAIKESKAMIVTQEVDGIKRENSKVKIDLSQQRKEKVKSLVRCGL